MGFNTGDMHISKCTLMTGDGTAIADIHRRVFDFSVFESIFKPYSLVEMSVVDNSDMLNYNLGMTGNNALSLEFNQAGQPPYKGDYIVRPVGKPQMTQNQRTALYRFSGYSPHMVKFPIVQDSYTNLSATDVASKLFTKFLSPKKPIDIRAPSKGLMGNEMIPFTVNGLPIHKAIKNVLLRAASTKDPSSAYMIFEDQKSIVIDTLENMIKSAADAAHDSNRTFWRKVVGTDFLNDSRIAPFNIMAMRENSRIDMTHQDTTQVQRTATFDLASLGTTLKQNNFGKTDAKTQPTTYVNTSYNLLAPPSYVKDFLAARRYMASVFDSQSVTIHVPFNPYVTVGKGFNIQTNAPTGDTNDQRPDKIAGVLLATEVRHTVKMTHDTVRGTTTIRGVMGPRNTDISGTGQTNGG